MPATATLDGAPQLNNLLPPDMGLTLVEKIAARHADGLAPGTRCAAAISFRFARAM